MKKIGVLGAGSWGTTLAILLANKKNDVIMWEFDKKKYESLVKYRENKLLLPEILFPDNLKLTNNIYNAVKNKDYIIFSVPTQSLRHSISIVSKYIKKDTIIISTSKGLELNTGFRPSQVIKDEISKECADNVVALSGPTIAKEVSKEMPSAIVAAGKIKSAKEVQNLFATSYFRVYTNEDIIGVEYGGAIKNCIAIAAGIIDGLNLGDNTKAALITRGLSEITSFTSTKGAKGKSFYGLSGVGDLIVTCTSQNSRNRFVGEKLGKGFSVKEVLDSMCMTAEGVPTVKILYEMAKNKNIEMPIINALYSIIYEKHSPKKTIENLMNRDLKQEFI